MAVQLEERTVTVTGEIAAVVVVLSYVVDVLKFLLRHVELLYLPIFGGLLCHGDPVGRGDVFYVHEADPMVHSS